jgi:hypothetical protein
MLHWTGAASTSVSPDIGSQLVSHIVTLLLPSPGTDPHTSPDHRTLVQLTLLSPLYTIDGTYVAKRSPIYTSGRIALSRCSRSSPRSGSLLSCAQMSPSRSHSSGPAVMECVCRFLETRYSKNSMTHSINMSNLVKLLGVFLFID